MIYRNTLLIHWCLSFLIVLMMNKLMATVNYNGKMSFFPLKLITNDFVNVIAHIFVCFHLIKNYLIHCNFKLNDASSFRNLGQHAAGVEGKMCVIQFAYKLLNISRWGYNKKNDLATKFYKYFRDFLTS